MKGEKLRELASSPTANWVQKAAVLTVRAGGIVVVLLADAKRRVVAFGYFCIRRRLHGCMGSRKE